MPYLIRDPMQGAPTPFPPDDLVARIDEAEADITATDGPTPMPVFHEGQVLDDTYRIVRAIGEGGMGVVYEAAHARLAGRYAVKALIHKLSDNPEALFRFDREARITSTLQHPNIVQVIDFNRHTDGTEYLVMEYLQGETLGERLRRVGALPVGVVVGIVEQIAAGLAAAHSHGVVHRDLKPENVFLVPVEGRHVELAKVLDFGISKVSEVHRSFQRPESALMGTPEYMSPEQFQGRAGSVDAASDQFALAAITYQMLTGRTPFSGDSVGDVMARVLHDSPPPMGIHPTLERVVFHGLAKSKLQRFPSVTAFADALRAAALIVGPPARARRPVALSPVRAIARFDDQEVPLPRPRRNRGPVLAVITALSVVVFVVVGSSGVRSMLMPRWSLPVVSDGERGASVEVPPEVAPEVPPEVPPEVRSAEVRPIEVEPIEVRRVDNQPRSATGDRRGYANPLAKKRALARARAAQSRATSTAIARVPRPFTPPPVEISRPPSRRPLPADADATLPLDETLVGAP